MNTGKTFSTKYLLDSNNNKGVEVTGGMILTSPNGTKYEITVANDGTLTSTAV